MRKTDRPRRTLVIKKEPCCDANAKLMLRFKFETPTVLISAPQLLSSRQGKKIEDHLNQFLGVVDCSLGGRFDDDVDTHHECHETTSVLDDELTVDSSSCVHRHNVL